MRRDLVRVICGALLVLALVGTVWLCLSAFPSVLFAHELRRANVVLFAHAPFPEQATALLDDVVVRLQRSPLYDARREYRAFLCATHTEYAIATLWRKGSGLTNPWGNVFVRPADIVHGRVFGRDRSPKPDERSLVYYLTHELTHAMTFAHLGWWRARRLPVFLLEGYADHVAFARSLRLRELRQGLVDGQPQFDTRATGSYLRYELLVAYLLEHRGLSIEQLLAQPLDQRAVERHLVDDPALSVTH